MHTFIRFLRDLIPAVATPILVLSLGVLGLAFYGVFSDRITMEFATKLTVISGASAFLSGVSLGLCHRWKTWWSIPAIVRQLGDVSLCDTAFRAIVESGDTAGDMFLQGLTLTDARSTAPEPTYSDRVRQRLAVEGLGVTKDPQGVPTLQQIVRRPSSTETVLLGKAIWSLGEIGGSQSVEELVRLLAWNQVIEDSNLLDDAISVKYHRALKRSVAIVEGKTMGDLAAEALTKLGQADLVEAFRGTLEGRHLALAPFLDRGRTAILQALTNASRSEDQAGATNALLGIGSLGLVEALPDLHNQTGFFSGAPEWKKKACAEAIRKLEAFQHLPIPAEGTQIDHDALPRTASAEVNTENLPRRHTN